MLRRSIAPIYWRVVWTHCGQRVTQRQQHLKINARKVASSSSTGAVLGRSLRRL